MARSLTAGVIAETAMPALRLGLFAEFQFDSGTVRLWSGIGDLAWNGFAWTGAGTLGSVSPIEETAALGAMGVTFTLSGVSPALLAIALGESYQGRLCRLWLGFFDQGWAIVADPVEVFSGRMDRVELADEGSTATIRLAAENRLIDFERAPSPRFYTPEDQKGTYPMDKGLDFVPGLQSKVILWGRAPFNPPRATSGGGGTGGGGTNGGPTGGRR